MNSSTTTAGAQALSTQYNNLRKDVIVQAGQYAVSTGSANAFLLSIDAQYVAYTTGDKILFKSNFASTGACTINVNGLGVKSIVKNGSDALVANDILSGEVIELIYDGTNMQMAKTFKPGYLFGSVSSVSGSPTTATQLVKGGFVDMLATGYKGIQSSGTIGTAIIEISANGTSGWTTLASKSATGYFQFSTPSPPIIIALSAFIPVGQYFRCNMSNVDTIVSVVANYQPFV